MSINFTRQWYDEAALRSSDSEDPSADYTELAAYVSHRLEKELPQIVVAELYEIQTELRRTQETLARRLESNGISREGYLRNLADALQRFAENNRRVLGTHDYMVVFGEAGDNPEALVDEELFLHGQKESYKVAE